MLAWLAEGLGRLAADDELGRAALEAALGAAPAEGLGVALEGALEVDLEAAAGCEAPELQPRDWADCVLAFAPEELIRL